jgi:hypothetical protein
LFSSRREWVVAIFSTWGRVTWIHVGPPLLPSTTVLLRGLGAYWAYTSAHHRWHDAKPFSFPPGVVPSRPIRSRAARHPPHSGSWTGPDATRNRGRIWTRRGQTRRGHAALGSCPGIRLLGEKREQGGFITVRYARLPRSATRRWIRTRSSWFSASRRGRFSWFVLARSLRMLLCCRLLGSLP